MNEAPRYTSLRDYLRVLRDHWFVILLVTVVGGGVALAVSLREDPVYEATSSIVFEDELQQLTVLGGSVGSRTPTGDTPQARAQTIDEPSVLRRVQRSLDDQISLEQLSGAISTSLDEESFLVDVTASWDDADFSAQLANDFAREAVAYTNRQTRNEYRSALEGVTSRSERLPGTTDTAAERALLTEQIARLRFLADNAEPASVAELASAPGAAISPKTSRNVALGLLLGLVTGVLIAFLRDTLDRRLRGPRQVEDELGYPVLGRVRERAMGKILRPADGSKNGSAADLEALRIIRQNLELQAGGDLGASDRAQRTILVTSSAGAEGKTTVATGLAFASAAAGERTLLVEADTRRPTLASRLGLQSGPGLTDHLVGNVEAEEILQPSPGGEDALSVTCVVSGSKVGDPAALLGSGRFGEFLEWAHERYSVVIVDCSPLVPVADTLGLLPLADSVVLCVRSGETTREVAGQAKDALNHRPDASPVGLVITGLRRRDQREYGYS